MKELGALGLVEVYRDLRSEKKAFSVIPMLTFPTMVLKEANLVENILYFFLSFSNVNFAFIGCTTMAT